MLKGKTGGRVLPLIFLMNDGKYSVPKRVYHNQGRTVTVTNVDFLLAFSKKNQCRILKSV
jgi:hypothetical protein